MVTDQLHWRRTRYLALSIGATLALLGVGAAPGSASAGAERQGAQLLQRFQAGEQKCQQLSRDQSESIGEYVMGRMLGSTARHDAMDRQIRNTSGASGEAQVHVFMGQRFTGCSTDAAPAAFGSMIGMMGSYSGANNGGMGSGSGANGGMGYGRNGANGSGTGMVGGSGSRTGSDNGWSSTSTVLIILLAALATALAAIAARRPWRRPTPKTPGELLSDRYARGDIDTADYEQRRHALEGLA